jgi:hypothetical protein
MVAVAAVVAATAGGVFATAAPANAIRQCGGSESMTYGVAPSGTSLSVDDAIIDFNNLSCDVNLPVSVSKYIGNVGWRVVATGTGTIIYNCTGGRSLYTTSVTTKEGKPAFYCG